MTDPAIHPAELVPPRAGLRTARLAAASCRACELWERATQTVFGEGAGRTTLALVGEQPGDHEDRLGHVFVGPAGRVLDEALESAGIDRERVFITNVVSTSAGGRAASGGSTSDRTPVTSGPAGRGSTSSSRSSDRAWSWPSARRPPRR